MAADKSGLRFICILEASIILLLCFVIWSNRWSTQEEVSALLQSTVPTTEWNTSQNERIIRIMELWNKSLDLGNQQDVLPFAPHLQDCKKCSSRYAKLDSRGSNGEWPRWTMWRGALGLEQGGHLEIEDQSEEKLLNKTGIVEGPFPPWIQGADEDNLPMTRRAQRDIWLHQHPKDCSNAKFLMPEWQSVLSPGVFGAGAEMVALVGWLAFAIKENRVLITKDYHGADHEGCKGPGHARWSCYFVPEASQECIDRAKKLALNESAWNDGTITGNQHYPGGQQLMNFPILNLWGKPWESNQRTIQIGPEGQLLSDYYAENRRWWRAQAFRYFMRLPSEYLCNLLNKARHDAFGEKAARMVAESLPDEWPKVQPDVPENTSMGNLVWSADGPWIPRPMVSLHVRQGDKAREMEVFDFKHYMQLCELLRSRHPDVKDIWLSTEMQNVVEESSAYRSWDFHFTSIERQTGTMQMTQYMASLGKQKCFDNSFVNLFMAVDSDYFVGALGSTWSYIIDTLRVTSGKTMAGFLSVNGMNKYL